MATYNEGHFYFKLLFSLDGDFLFVRGPYLNDVTHTFGSLHILLFFFNLQGKTNFNGDFIVFVWSQYDGGNIEQRTIG